MCDYAARSLYKTLAIKRPSFCTAVAAAAAAAVVVAEDNLR